MTYNARRGFLGAALPPDEKIAWQLFGIEYNARKHNYEVKLLRKPQFPSSDSGSKHNIENIFRNRDNNEKHTESIDFDPTGTLVATIDSEMTCAVSEMETQEYSSILSIVNEGSEGN